MKIGIQTWGTEGDIRPFLALAAGLSERGHRVTLAVTEVTSRRFTEYGRRLGFEVQHVCPDEIDEDRLRRLAERMFAEWNPLKRADLIVSGLFNPHVDAILAASKRLCAENDLVIGHFFVYPLKVAARRRGIPHVSVVTAPVLPSRDIPPAGLPQILGRWVNPLLWSAADALLNRMWKPRIDRIYRREGLPPERSLLKDVWFSPLLTLVTASPALFQPPSDWEGRYHLCGFVNLPDAGEPWEMPASLRSFLEAGGSRRDVVYMTFGSMMASDPAPRESTALLVEAARRAGCRAIIQSNWDQLGDLPVSPAIHRITRAPHHRVFPHCAAVVHHGGAGTTQAATVAGCPSVVVAHSADQPLWGALLHRRGIAPPLLHRRSVTPETLARAIRRVLSDPTMTDAAQRTARRMRGEDGLATALALIEEYAARPGRLE